MCWGKADGVQKTLFFTKRSQLPPQRQADTEDRRGGGVSQGPYSHHQATDHPGHHPDSLGDGPQETTGGTLTQELGAGAEWCCGTPVPRCRQKPPTLTPTPQCEESGEPGTSGLRALKRKPTWELGGRTRSSAPRRRILAAQSNDSCRGEPRVRPLRAPLLVPGRDGRSRSPLSRATGVLGWRTTCTSVRGGVCNSLESCTEPGSAQPQCSSSRRRRNGAFRGAERGHGNKRPVP